MLERFSEEEMRQNVQWCQEVGEEFPPLAKKLDPTLWIESEEFGRELRSYAMGKLDELDVRLGGSGYYELIYFLTRYIEPEHAVETGVAAGFSSQAFLKAMEINGKGRLYSSDFPYFRLRNPEQYIGLLVEDALKERWELYLQGDRVALPRIAHKIPEINIFHYDSDKSYSSRSFALSVLSGALHEGSIIVMDDIHDNPFFKDYVKAQNRPWRVISFQGKFAGLIGL